MSRRRIYLMRHGEVSYYDDGRPVHPDGVPLTAAGREQAQAAADALAGIEFDRVVTSNLPRTVETARIVAPGLEPEPWPELRELTSGRLGDFSAEELERMFLGAFKDVVPEEAQFLGGETIGALYDRVIAALERLLASEWDIVLAVLHGGVNRAILSYALTSGSRSSERLDRSVQTDARAEPARPDGGTASGASGGGRTFLGNLEQAPGCINVLDVGDDWIVRAVNVTPYDLAHRRGRLTTMEELWSQFRST